MPTGIPRFSREYGSLGEQLLGQGDDKRSTKTFIEDGTLAMALGMFQGLPEMIINIGRRLHAEEFDIDYDDVSTDMILKEYPEARELIHLHQTIIEHKGSQGGYLVDRYTGSQRKEELETRDKKSGSSGEVSKPKRWE